MLVRRGIDDIFGVVLFITGVIALVILVKKRVIKQTNVVHTYKCERCSRYFAFKEDIVIDP